MSACPQCGTYASLVLDSEPAQYGYRWRRRRCKECGARWNTYEVPAESLTITPEDNDDQDGDRPDDAEPA